MGSVAITQGSGTPIRTVSNPAVDGGAQVQVMTLADDTGDFLFSKNVPQGTEDAILVRPLPTQMTRRDFSKVLASGVDLEWGVITTGIGSGMTVSQNNSNLIITAGTTARSETIIRTNATFTGATRLRIRSQLSQRIANQRFYAEFVDVIQDAAAVTINSSTSITVTLNTNPFTATNVGQTVHLGGYSGSGVFLSGRWPIASVSGNTVTFTVSGFTAGSGTVSLFGWNAHYVYYDGTTATQLAHDVVRNGWSTGAAATTVNTSASPGHLAVLAHNDSFASLMDALVAPNTGVQFLTRATRIENIPDDIPMRFQIRVVNLGTAPASSTTWTIGQVTIGNWASQDVNIQEFRPTPNSSALPVQIANNPGLGVNINGIPAVNIGATTKTGNFYTSTTTNAATVLKASAGDLQTLWITNTSTSTQYVKVYNATAVTLGTTAAVIDIPVPAGGTVSPNLGPNGQRFGTGIAIAVTGGLGATNNTAGVGGVMVATTIV